ncbi:Amidase [Verminephrobacter eiseniae EF01-2]|uniref:Amidase n=2 Tax=Verminephrobacter eiseniae TaxID=364317 RepID=A1WEP5_VEREI|nr:Amidase [Verminephrobacter eiseniae EF01-2]
MTLRFPMQDDEYEALDGLALAALMKDGQVSASELMECAIRLATARAPGLNALTYPRYEEALARAKDWAPRGAFGGIPFLLKDSGLASRRLPSSIGSRLFEDTRYAQDATLVARFEAGGFIAFARTTVPELCMAPTTEALRNGGPARNPWDRGRSAGGSSGGAAAAVAAGIVPIAHGSDGGGSIRIPAACCGLFGLKPSRGVVPMGPLRGEGWGGLAVDGVLSRTVRDTAAAIDAVAGIERGAPYAAPALARSLRSAVGDAPRRLRIGVWRAAFAGIDIAPECVEAVDATADLCRALGHEVIDGAPPADFDYAGFVEAHTDVLGVNIVLSVDARLQMLGRSLRPTDLEPSIMDGYAQGRSISAARYAAAIHRFHSIARFMDDCLGDFDILMTPALVQLPAPLGELEMRDDFRSFRRRMARYSCHLAIVNASGQPAASLPTHWTAQMLPVGTQIIGRFGCDDVVVQLAAQIEATGRWHPRQRKCIGPGDHR